MGFIDKVFWGGAGLLVLFLIMLMGEVSDKAINTTLIIGGAIVFLWAMFDNRMSLTISISALAALFSAVLGGWFLAGLVFILLMVLFWFREI
jgi:hypothetical protein